MQRPDHQAIPTYVFVGPFHTGKTTLAKKWRPYLLGSQGDYIVIDMKDYRFVETWDSFCNLVRHHFDINLWDRTNPIQSINNKLFILEHATQCSPVILKRIYKMLRYGEVETSHGYFYPIAGAAYVLTMDLFNFEISELKEEFLKINHNIDDSDLISAYFDGCTNLFEMQHLLEKMLTEQYLLPGFLKSKLIIFDELAGDSLKGAIRTFVQNNKKASEHNIRSLDTAAITKLVQLYTSSAFGRAGFMDELRKAILQSITKSGLKGGIVSDNIGVSRNDISNLKLAPLDQVYSSMIPIMADS